MSIKVEKQTAAKLPKRTEEWVKSMLATVPREHLRGLDRIRIVDSIIDPRLRLPRATELPGLYHPRQGTQQAWLEIAAETLLPSSKPAHKRLLPRLSFKSNLAAVLFSLIAQHYHLTLRHSIKKGQLEQAVRAYTEKHLRAWNERSHSWRARLFRPLQPVFERWARALQRRVAQEKKKTARG